MLFWKARYGNLEGDWDTSAKKRWQKTSLFFFNGNSTKINQSDNQSEEMKYAIVNAAMSC